MTPLFLTIFLMIGLVSNFVQGQAASDDYVKIVVDEEEADSIYTISMHEDETFPVCFSATQIEDHFQHEIEMGQKSFCDEGCDRDKKPQKAWYASAMEQMQAGWRMLKSVREDLSYLNYVRNEYNAFAESFFGTGYLQFAGYYCHQSATGKYRTSNRQFKNVRVTCINGMLTARADLDEYARLLSTTHGGIEIHYVFRATEGWTKDIINCCMIKMGYYSPHMYALVQLWKQLIQELGGTESGGRIIHYAHSIGGTDTAIAATLLTPEEKKMIHVVTLGSPTLIPNQGFGSVSNYVSKRDGVGLFKGLGLVDIVTYIRALENCEDDFHLSFIGSLWGVPLVDHTLASASYQQLIEDLGAEFVSTYMLKEE